MCVGFLRTYEYTTYSLYPHRLIAEKAPGMVKKKEQVEHTASLRVRHFLVLGELVKRDNAGEWWGPYLESKTANVTT
jgi:hypothetical protein